jgi:hypothetical protein
MHAWLYAIKVSITLAETQTGGKGDTWTGGQADRWTDGQPGRWTG